MNRGSICRTFLTVAALWLGSLGVVAVVPLSFSWAQEPAEARKPTPLSIRQQRVERMMGDLEAKFEKLAISLAQTEPQRAERLKKTLVAAKTLGVKERMANITKMLEETQLETANEGQRSILTDVRKLLELLLEEEKATDEEKKLKDLKEALENIIKEEKAQEKESDKIANKDDTLANLQKQIESVQKLIQEQQNVIKNTAEARAKGAQALGPISDAQRKVREATEKVAAEIEGKPTPTAKPAEPKEGDPKEGTPKEGAPKEGTPGAGKEGTPKEGAGKEGAPGKEGAGKEGAGKEGAGKEGAGKEGAGKEGMPPGAQEAAEKQPAENPSAQALERAAANQKTAEKNLDEGKGRAAETEEQKALENLKQALAKLQNEQARIAKLPPEAFDEMAKKQDDTANKTAKLAEDSKKSEGGGEGKGGEGGEGGEGGGKKKPGQKNIQKAKQSMEQASGGLKKKQPADANKDQREAIKELQKAIQEIEDRLAQLREETQLEKLARLEARFAQMLAMQESATKDTTVLAKKKTDGVELTRADRLQVGKIGTDETKLAEMAQQAFDIIVEDGTSVVFPEVVGQLRDDLVGVAQLLGQQRADDYTVSRQQEVETTLKELIEALQKAQQQKKQGGGGGGGGGGGEPPLFPNSAELKLLRSMQMRVNSRTTSLDKAFVAAGKKDDPVLQKEISGIATRQQEIADLTQQMIERAQ